MSTPVSTVKHDKESFRRYLEHTGVVDCLSKALSQLFERHEQGRDPEDPQDLVRRVLNGDASTELGKLKEENARLSKTVEGQRKRIEQLESQLKAAEAKAKQAASAPAPIVAPAVVPVVAPVESKAKQVEAPVVVAEEKEDPIKPEDVSEKEKSSTGSVEESPTNEEKAE